MQFIISALISGIFSLLVAERVRLIQSDAGQLDWRENRRVADHRRETLRISDSKRLGQ